MEHDSETVISRVERTLLTVWNYITGAVNRFLRSEPNNDNDPNSFQQPAVNSEPAGSGHTEGDTSGGGADEEQLLATSSLLSSSRPVVAWEMCTTGINLGPEEEGQTGNDEAGLLISKDAKAKKEEENRDWKSHTRTQGETPDNDEYEEHAKKESLNLADHALGEDLEGSRKKAGADDETMGAMTLSDHQKIKETMRTTQVKEEDDKMHHDDEQDLQVAGSEVTVYQMTELRSEEERIVHTKEVIVQSDEVDTAVTHEEVENSHGALQLALENENKSEEDVRQVENQFSAGHVLSENNGDVKGEAGFTLPDDEFQITFKKSGNLLEDVGREYVMTRRGESDKVEVESEKEGESTLEMGVRGGVAADNQVVYEKPKQEKDFKAVTEDGQQTFTKHVKCTEEVVQNAEAELHAAELTDEEKEDVDEDIEVQTKTREMDNINDKVISEKPHVTTDISADERFFDKDEVEERLSSGEEDNKEVYMNIASATTTVTVNPEGDTIQEISRDLKNVPPGICEGRSVVSQELNSLMCEETQEGVPEYNNAVGLHEITTQRFLEVGDRKEIHATRLPGEVESEESESLHNSGTAVDCLLVREHMEEEQESTEEHIGILHLTDTGLTQKTDKLLVEPAIEGSGNLFDEEKLLGSSMKTGIEHSEKESETHSGVTGETNEATKDGTEELLVEFEVDGGLSDSRDAAADSCETAGAVAAEDSVVTLAKETSKILEAEVQEMTEKSFFPVSGDATNSEPNGNKTSSLIEEITESGFMKQWVETQDAGIDVEEAGYGVEEEAVKDKMQNKPELEIVNLGVVEMTAVKTTENSKNILFSESELSRPNESAEKKNQPSDKAFEMGSEGSFAEQSSSVGQDVTDEEIDLWIQTALLKDTAGMGQQAGPEPVQVETEKEQHVEFSSGESGLVSDTETSSTAESGILDQSVSECSTDHSETRLVKSTSRGSLQGINDMSEFQVMAMEEAPETEQSDLTEEELSDETGFHPDLQIISLEAGHVNQESDESQEITDGEQTDSAVNETGSQIEIDSHVTDQADRKDTNGADVETKAKMRALFKGEKAKVEDTALGETVSDSPDEIKHSESGRSEGSSEPSLQEEFTLTELQDDTYTESEKLRKFPSLDKPQPEWPEDIVDSSPELNRAEVAEQPRTKSEDHFQVEASVLDFTAQRSRISVKNPRVRPPKDPRSLIHMPSVEPTSSSHLPFKVPTGVPLGGMGIGIKLPGLGVGFPVLKKTQRVAREEKSSETISQKPETKPDEESDTPKQDEAHHKPKWMPPGHPGFGNPLMSELKTKLKKTT